MWLWCSRCYFICHYHGMTLDLHFISFGAIYKQSVFVIVKSLS
jgi:hypothetical protein